MNDNDDDLLDPQDQGAVGGGNIAAGNADDPARDQDPDLEDLVQGIRDPRVIRVVQDMQNRFDQRLLSLIHI